MFGKKNSGPEDGDFSAYIDKLNKKEIPFEGLDASPGTPAVKPEPEKPSREAPSEDRPAPRRRRRLDPVLAGFLAGFAVFVAGGLVEEEFVIFAGFAVSVLSILAGGMFRRRK